MGDDIGDMSGNIWRVSMEDNSSTWTYSEGMVVGHNPHSVAANSTIINSMIRPVRTSSIIAEDVATALRSPAFQNELEAAIMSGLGKNISAIVGPLAVVQSFVWPEDVAWKSTTALTVCTCADGSEGTISMDTC